MKKEISAYYKMLRGILAIKSNPNAIPVKLLDFLDGFHKYWRKYYSKEFTK